MKPEDRLQEARKQVAIVHDDTEDPEAKLAAVDALEAIDWVSEVLD